MRTSHNGPHRIAGIVPEGYDRKPRMTEKAVRVTVERIDGESARVDTVWLPRSICADLKVFAAREDGVAYTAFTATVPAWWVRKLDDRTAWQHAGLARPPMATRPC